MWGDPNGKNASRGAMDNATGIAISYEVLKYFKENPEKMPENCRADDRICITTAKAALRLRKSDYLEAFFATEHHAISEGETTLTDLWFGFCALKLAKERGIANPTEQELADLADEAWDLCPPDASIDFRMSLDRKNKYRI
jgi:hypothetical protein